MAIDKRLTVPAAPAEAGVPKPKRARPHDCAVAVAVGGEGEEVASTSATIEKAKVSSRPAAPASASRPAPGKQGGGGGGLQRPRQQSVLPPSNLPASAIVVDRRWMYEGWRKNGAHSKEWAVIAEAFIKRAFCSATTRVVKCPCSKCHNLIYQEKSDVERDLCKFGFMPNYEIWYQHGESRHAEPAGGKCHGRTSMDGVKGSGVKLSQGRPAQCIAGGGRTTENQEVARLRDKLAQSEAARLLQDQKHAFLEGQLKAKQDMLKAQQDFWVSLWRQQQDTMHAYFSWYGMRPMPFAPPVQPPPMMFHPPPPPPRPRWSTPTSTSSSSSSVHAPIRAGQGGFAGKVQTPTLAGQGGSADKDG